MQEHEQHERKWYLAAKLLSGRLESAEQAEWDVLMGDEEFRREFGLVRKYWNKMEDLPYQQIDTQKDWKAVWEKIRHQMPVREKRSIAPWMRYAAMIAMCMAVSFFIGWGVSSGLFESSGQPMLTTVEAPAASKTLITLPDNSKVWLNAHSRLTYDERFGTDNRYLTLKGEAFFDVVKSTIPFTVHTDVYDISVLGTAFNVKAYADDDKAVTTLVRGSLKIRHVNASGEMQETYLKPNEKLVASKVSSGNAGQALNVHVERGIDAVMETAWKDGWLSVRGESLNDLARKIERLYDVKIDFRDQNLGAYRYTGRVRQLSLEQVLKALSLTSPIEFSISEKTVTLWENKSVKSKYRSLQEP